MPKRPPPRGVSGSRKTTPNRRVTGGPGSGSSTGNAAGKLKYTPFAHEGAETAYAMQGRSAAKGQSARSNAATARRRKAITNPVRRGQKKA